MPSAIASYQKKVTVRKLHQAYNFLKQAEQLAIAEYGDEQTWDCLATVNLCSGAQFASKYIVPYFKGTYVVSKRSLTQLGYKNYPKTLNGERTLTAHKDFIFTKQGYLYMLDPYTTIDNTRTFYMLYIDINGKSGPNILGKDIFRLTYGYNGSASKHYRLQMFNWSNLSREQLLSSSCNKNNTGEYCGAVIETDGWEIKDDYPW